MGWKAPGQVDRGEWLRWGRFLTRNVARMPWAIGDWLRYGTDSFGVGYGQAHAATGYAVQSLRNMSYVASRFDRRRRRDAVPGSAHAAVASLAPAFQDVWLDKLECEHLSIRQLRTLVAASRAGAGAAQQTQAGLAPVLAGMRCPCCGQTLARATPTSRRRRG